MSGLPSPENRRLRAYAPFCLIVLLTTACSPPNDGPVSVAVAVEPLAWLVGQIGGEEVAVSSVVPAGTSPETFQPDDAQVSRLLRSRAYFRVGIPFENGDWLREIASSGRLEVVDLRRDLPAADDPHVWLSPRLLAVQARIVAATLERVDPDHAATFAARRARLEDELAALDDELRRTLAPLAGLPFFVYHPSWGRFADAYGLRQVAIEVEGKEPDDHHLTEIQLALRESGAKALFVQPQVQARSASAVAAATGVRLETADPLAHDVPANLRRFAALLVAAGPGAAEEDQ